jgi:RHS repeat-associated protein
LGDPVSPPGQIISLPQGGGALRGIGEKFSPDLFTGTGNSTIPIALPPGRNGFKPELNLVYSSGSGNGPFGLGWNLSLPGVSRKTSKGIPQYDDGSDTFILSGAEDLVPVDGPVMGLARYRPRTEGLFARIVHHRPDAANNYWEVRTKDGRTSLYGTAATAGNDPAVIADPSLGDQARIFAWKLSSTTDPYGNLIRYVYQRDAVRTDGPHHWSQLYLSQIRCVDYGDDRSNPNFLVRVNFIYDDRPDHFSDYRAGFEIRTVRRCARIEIMAGGDTSVRTYHLDYADAGSTEARHGQPNGASLLRRVRVEGHDGAVSEWLPPLEFGYTEFAPQGRKFIAIKGSLPAQSLADPNLELVDLFGSGLPDILEMNNSVRYWRNLGNGRFALPHGMEQAPPLQLSAPGVQMLDANGDGTADLLVTTPQISGYYPLRFDGTWDRHSFQRYVAAPSFDLKDPEVHFVDLDGDGVTDALRSSTRFECYFSDAERGWISSRRVPRGALDVFPNVNFSDPRVKWADMNGDGLQDIVFVHDGLVEYWPSLGWGNWGRGVEMPGPRFPWGYNPRRILFGDIDGDGAADLIYVDDMRVTLWINQSGNGWAPPVTIEGTPPVADTDSVRLVDLMGNGIAGLLWSKNANGTGRPNAFFLDFTGGIKPYLLSEMNNHMGALTQVEYRPSTWFYLRDCERPETRWTTPLPFPVQVVARVRSHDPFSGGTLSTEYRYHHGYWDGFEREFRGFGRVDHRDAEEFGGSATVPQQYFSPPTETHTWFHQGAIGDRFDGWTESDARPAVPGQKRFGDEYYKEPWPGSRPLARVLSRPSAMNDFIGGLPPSVRRDAFRSMRGRVLRSELYALDGSPRQDRPYTVTEHVYGVREESPPAPCDSDRLHIFFPFVLAERTTQWERGKEPLNIFTISDNCSLKEGGLETANYDRYGQLLSQIRIAVPRGRAFLFPAAPAEPYLATETATAYAQRDDDQVYIVDRTASAASYEIVNDGSAAVFDFARQIQAGAAPRNVMSQSLSFYDGGAFQGLLLGQLGNYGALVRTETLCLTPAFVAAAYGANPPPYLSAAGPPNWTPEYPQEFRNRLPALAGYVYRVGGAGVVWETGYYQATGQCQYDFQAASLPRGLITTRRDPLGHDSAIDYDDYGLMPVAVTQAAGLPGRTPLVTRAQYDYRVFQPELATDPNGNQTAYSFTPLGLLHTILVMGKPGEGLGDEPGAPGTRFTYTLFGVDAAGDVVPVADLGEPASVRTSRRVHHASETGVPLPERDETIDTVEFSDGFGRVLQTRTQAEDVLFDSAVACAPTFGDAGLSADQTQSGGDAAGGLAPPGGPFVVVSGWQVYDNKGQVVEKYEPFFSTGWDYAAPDECQFGRKAVLHYDPCGHVVRTVYPDGSEQRVVYGVPGTIAAPDLTTPDDFEPTPWEAYTYDANDNAGRTHPATSGAYRQDWDTPSSIVVDALGRTVVSVERNRELHAGIWSPVIAYTTSSTFDIVGNLVTVTDALGRVAFAYSYDLAKHALRSASIDAGVHTIVLDAAAGEIERRDCKGTLGLRAYDVVNRPIRMWARDVAGETVTLREKSVYGDDAAGSGFTAVQAAGLNMIGKLYQQYDEAGLLTFAAYDFKGNPLVKTRNVIAAATLLAPFGPPPPANWVVTPFRIDWGSADLSFIDTAVGYETTTTYDALNRVETMQYPQDVGGARKLLVPVYNRAGALESVKLDDTTYVERIAYNAKGQRILVAYGNGLMTRYAYDPDTFRLLRMRTEAYAIPQASPPVYRPSAPSTPLQDFGYGYDLVGNILATRDRTPGCGIRNTPLGADALDRGFAYDPIYRLVSATGREHERALVPRAPPWDDTIHPIDITRARAYAETYRYDRVGNVALWRHAQIGAGGTASTTSRAFALDPNNASNRLSKLTLDPSTSYAYAYDASGNLVQENSERHFEWDHADRMRVFRNQTDGAEPSIHAQYAYDSGGNRVLKLVRKAGGQVELTISIDGIFEYQSILKPSQAWENNTLHVMDNKGRIALVRVGNPFPDDGAPEVPVKYQLADHLGSSNVVVDQTGNVVNREEYFPYGETSFGSYARKRYRFTGKERDEESSLYYHGARYCAPWLARWISCDPASPLSLVNLYQYCFCNPNSSVDPSGLQAEDINGVPDAGSDTAAEGGYTSGTFVFDSVAGARPSPELAPDASPIETNDAAPQNFLSTGRFSASLLTPNNIAPVRPADIDEMAVGQLQDMGLLREALGQPADTSSEEFDRQWLTGMADIMRGLGWYAFVADLAGDPFQPSSYGSTGARPQTSAGIAGSAAKEAESVWQQASFGTQVRKLGDIWVKRIDPNASMFRQWWGRMAIKAQAEGLAKLGDIATPFRYEDGLLLTQDVGETSSYFSSSYWQAFAKGSARMGTLLNDIRPRNVGLNGLIFDPALDPISKGLLVGGGAAAAGTGIYGAYKRGQR